MHKSGFVNIIGNPNVGKSTLMNVLVGERLSIITSKAQTPRHRIMGIVSGEDFQIVYSDTPGILKPSYKLQESMMKFVTGAVTDADVILYVTDTVERSDRSAEIIERISRSGIPTIVVINKIDKPNANPDHIKEQLSQMNYLVESWGGKYQDQEVSAKKGINLDKLLEKVLLEAEMLDLKANPNKKAQGTVIESTLDKGRGYVSTILVQSGTLRVGDVILSGTYTGRVKAMFNENGKKVETAGPSTPVQVLGLNGAPQAGDTFNVMDDDRSAREIANKREQLARMQGIMTQKHVTLDEIGRRIAIGSFKELNIIVKGDVDGSVEAMSGSLIKLSKETVQVNVIHAAVGQISESDVLLAAASNAIIVGFNVRPDPVAEENEEEDGETPVSAIPLN